MRNADLDPAFIWVVPDPGKLSYYYLSITQCLSLGSRIERFLEMLDPDP